MIDISLKDCQIARQIHCVSKEAHLFDSTITSRRCITMDETESELDSKKNQQPQVSNHPQKTVVKFTSFPVDIHPFSSLNTPRFSILYKTMRVLGSRAWQNDESKCEN
jgi:hypothetical protein